MSVLTGSMVSTNANFPHAPVRSEGVTNISSTSYSSSEEEGSSVAEDGSSDDHSEEETENEVQDEESDENNTSLDVGSNQRHNVSASETHRDNTTSNGNGLLIINVITEGAAAPEPERVHQSQSYDYEEHMNQQRQLGDAAEKFINSLCDERVEELITQIHHRLLPRNPSTELDLRMIRYSEEHPKPEPEPKRRRREILEAMIRSLGADWNQYIDFSVMSSWKMHFAQELQRNDSIINQSENSHADEILQLEEDEERCEHDQRIDPQRRTNIFIRFCTFNQRSCDEVRAPLRSLRDRSLEEARDRKNMRADEISVAGTEKLVDKLRQRISRININIVLAVLILFIVVIVGFVGVFLFFVLNPTNVTVATTNKTERAAVKLTKTISRSLPITSPQATRLRIDYFKNNIMFSTQVVNNRSNIETTFLEEFLHEEAVVSRYVKTSEMCAQISAEIICCETFCEGRLKEGHIITRKFSPHSQFCGAWRYEFNTAYICTRKQDQITITEFWSAKDYRFTHPTVNIANFQAIDYLPNHVAVIWTKNSSNSHQFCLANFGRKSLKQMKCRNIDFLGLEQMDKSTTRQIVYLQHMIWAIVTSKLENNYVQWSIYVFNDMQLIFKETDNLFSADSELVVFGESPVAKVCAVELKDNRQEKFVSCTAYKYELF